MFNGITKKIGQFKTTNEYFNATFVYIIANGIGQGTTLLANIFFTRYMSKSEYGLYSNYFSYVAILVPFVGLNLYYGLTNAYLDYKEEIHKVRSSVLSFSIVGLILSILVIFAVDAIVGLTLPTVCIFIALVHAYGFFLINYYIQSMNMENRFKQKGLALAVPNVLQALLAGLAVILCNTYISRAVGAMFAILLCGIVSAYIILRESKPIINTDYWRYVLKISLPAIIGSVSAMIMQQCDKVMITALIDAEETAVYALIYNIGYILYAVIQATSGAWQAWLFNTIDNKKIGNIKDVQKWYLYFMLILATGLYMLAPEIIKVLSPRTYWKFEYVVPFVIGSYLIHMYTMNMGIIQYYKRTDINSAIVTIATIINVMLNYVLIPRFGGIAAAYTSIISYVIIYGFSNIYLRIKHKYYYSELFYVISISIVIICGIIYYMVMNRAGSRYILFMFILIVEGLFISGKKKEIKRLFGGNVFS